MSEGVQCREVQKLRTRVRLTPQVAVSEVQCKTRAVERGRPDETEREETNERPARRYVVIAWKNDFTSGLLWVSLRGSAPRRGCARGEVVVAIVPRWHGSVDSPKPR